MTREQRLDKALKNMDFYELAKLTCERSNPMKIKIKQVKSEEQLEFHGNRLFTQEQLQEIEGA